MTDQLPTTDELMVAIPAAIRAGDFQAVESLIGVLAVVNPRVAQNVFDVLRIAADIRRDA